MYADSREPKRLFTAIVTREQFNELAMSEAKISHELLINNGIMSPTTIKWLKNQRKIVQVQRGCKGTPALFLVDSLPLKYRVEVYRRFPDLKEKEESKPFIDTIEPDVAALDFFENYILADGRHFKSEKITEYSNNAAILNAFHQVLIRSNSERIKQSHKRFNKTEFWRRAAQALPRIADTYVHSLPSNPRRLHEKFNQYQREGYSALIPGKYGIRTAAKISNEMQESVITQLIADARNLDNTRIARLYNLIAEAKGWKTITEHAVSDWRRKLDLVTAGGRLGATRFRAQKSMQLKRSRPTLPLLYWTLDGWTAELLYQKTVTRTKKDGTQSNVTTYTNRLTLVLVLDPFNNYPVGYAIGERETPELIKAALRNAVNHTAELFGKRYRVNQLQSDNYGRGNLTPLYQVVGKTYTPARAHNAKAKVIEPFFGYFNKKYCQICKNWSGFGITSNKNLQPNSEFLNKHRHSFPTEDECRQQLITFVERERSEKYEQYVTMFAKLPEERRLPLSDEQYLLNFGSDTGYCNTLEGSGLRPKIEGIKRAYDCFDIKFREYAHVKWSVKYDPDNLDRVLAVNEDGTLRFILENKYVQPMALADRQEGDVEQLDRINQFNKQLEAGITTRLAHTRRNVEQLFNSDPQLDVATRLLLCDSDGQNKNNKQTRRLQANEIQDINYQVITNPSPQAAKPTIEDDTEYYSEY